MTFKKTLIENINLKKKLISLEDKIEKAVLLITNAIRNEGKILICGNGGSAADAQHLAAEFLVRLKSNNNRRAYPVISLALDTSSLTACGNDLGFSRIFSRNLEALGKTNDILIVISTSGNSKNIIEALKVAQQKKIKTIALLGSGGGKAKKLSNLNITVPSKATARIQECHILLGHYIFESVEKNLKKK
jgi:D-sedoheptulose 7-phosphate isomerase|tara:strand:+ start:5517 stop:6086 length:570 start_codon:yes stop_codon:yes gene_type:complete